MAKKVLTNIKLTTEANGYSLTIEGKEFFYFTELDMLAGFLAHVGLTQTNEMDKTNIIHSLFNAMIGDAYADAVTTLKLRVGALTQQYETTIERMDKAIAYVTNAEKQIQGMKNRVESLDMGIAGIASSYAETRKSLDEAMKKWTQIEKKSNTVLDNITKATTKSEEKTDGKKGGKSRYARKDNSGTTDDVAETLEKASKGKGGRRKNDQAIIEQLKKEGQLK